MEICVTYFFLILCDISLDAWEGGGTRVLLR